MVFRFTFTQICCVALVYLREGRQLILKITQSVNAGRNSTNLNKTDAPNSIEINKVLSLKLPGVLTPEMSLPFGA